MDWRQMLFVGLLLGIGGAVVGTMVAAAWIAAGLGGAMINAALIGAAVRGPEHNESQQDGD